LFWWFRVVESLTLPSTGSLVSVLCDQPPLTCFGVCGRKAITKQNKQTSLWQTLCTCALAMCGLTHYAIKGTF
jgi:Fe-S-cluster-containing hydrogenase component 2